MEISKHIDGKLVWNGTKVVYFYIVKDEVVHNDLSNI